MLRAPAGPPTILFASMREKSRMSVMRVRRVSPEQRIVFTRSHCGRGGEGKRQHEPEARVPATDSRTPHQNGSWTVPHSRVEKRVQGLDKDCTRIVLGPRAHLCGAEGRVCQQLAHGNHAVEGGADLVRHARQELQPRGCGTAQRAQGGCVSMTGHCASSSGNDLATKQCAPAGRHHPRRLGNQLMAAVTTCAPNSYSE